MIKQSQCQAGKSILIRFRGSFQQRIQDILDCIGFRKLVIEHDVPVQSDDHKPWQIRNFKIVDDTRIPADQNEIGKLVLFDIRLHFSLLIDRIDRQYLNVAVFVGFVNL